MALTLVQRRQCLRQQCMAHAGLFQISDGFILQRTVILQQVLPLAFAFIIERDVERCVATHHHPAVHVDDFGL